MLGEGKERAATEGFEAREGWGSMEVTGVEERVEEGCVCVPCGLGGGCGVEVGLGGEEEEGWGSVPCGLGKGYVGCASRSEFSVYMPPSYVV